MPATPALTTLKGSSCRLYFDNTALASFDWSTPVWTEVGFFEDGEPGREISVTELMARIHRGLQTEAVSGVKFSMKGKLTRVGGLSVDPWNAFLNRAGQDLTKLGDQVAIAVVDGDIETAGTKGYMLAAIVKVFGEKQGKDIVQADVEFSTGIGFLVAGEVVVYEPILVT